MDGEARSVAHRSKHIERGGTTWLVIGSIVGGLAAYGFQVIGTRALGREGYAPIGALWTIQYLVWSVVLFTVETFVVRETLRAPGHRALPHATAIGAWRWVVATAGAVMMVEGSVVTLAALAWLFLRAAAEGELRQELLERGLDPRTVQRAVRYGRAEELPR
jgi:hypothetical protein